MPKKKLVYVWSLRNAAADQAGKFIAYRGEQRYMMSPLEYLVAQLNETSLGDRYSLEAVIHDDDNHSVRDRDKLGDYGFVPSENSIWFFPQSMTVRGKPVTDLMISIPSAYRQYPMNSRQRLRGKSAFEKSLENKLMELDADLIVLDGLLVILDRLARPDNVFHRKIVNIHPGITRLNSPYERRGASATLDALYGARGQKILDWQTMTTRSVPPLLKTGASFHYVDTGIDSGEVITDVLNTDIDPKDTILELRWNNFQRSLFPALIRGLEIMAKGDVVTESAATEA